jgi:hypothetical protein
MNLTQHREVIVKFKDQKQLLQRLGTVDLGREIIDNKRSIGGALTPGGVPLSGLTFAEESQYLPSIIGVSKNDTNFQTKVRDYWNNISISVPTSDRNGKGGGRILEVGFEYPDEEAAKKGMAEEKRELNSFEAALDNNKVYKMKFDVRNKVGRPINVNDFIAWRYCLAHSFVANRPEDANKSGKIKFYLYNKEIERKNLAISRKNRQKAYARYVELLDKRENVPHILLLMNDDVITLSEKDNITYNTSEEIDQDALLEKLATKKPVKFLEVSNDKNLSKKAFVEGCIAKGLLRRIPNSRTIMYETTNIGYNLEEAVQWILDPQNKQPVADLKAKYKKF